MPDPAAVELPISRVMLTVFLPFAGGYFLSYLYRSVNAIIAPQLTEELGLSAGDLGLLTAVYFLTFAAFQIPLGLLLDRFGPRRVQSCLLLSAALGAALFAWGDDRDALLLGRALIGLGVAGGLMASFKAITLWFPSARWPLVNGCFLAMGGLGAMAATAPVEAVLHITDWRGLFLGLSVATVAVAALIFLLVPTRKGERPPPTPLAEQLRGLRAIYRARLFWSVAPICVASMAANFSIQGLWAGPWLRDVADLPRDALADVLLASAAAMTVGFVGGGVIADLLGRIGVGLMRVMSVGILLFLIANAVLVFQVAPQAIWPWLLFGVTANMTMLAYPELSRSFPLSYAGRVNTALNLLVFVAGFTAQSAVGWIIDLWPTLPDGGYQPEAYRVAFGVLLALQILAFLWFLWRQGTQGKTRP